MKSLLMLLLVAGCGVKQTRNALASGDYDDAIATAASKLRSNKDAKGKQEYVYMLEEAYAKAKQRDESNVKMLVGDANPQNLEKIFQTYVQLNNRQEKIRPLLPLKLIRENRNASFAMEDYSDAIVSSKNALSAYLYENTQKLLKNPDKLVIRRAYDDLAYLDQINPNYKDTRKLMNVALAKGTDYVIVSTRNETNMVIPQRLQDELLNFDAAGLNDKWTAYHSAKQKGVDYDYGIAMNFRTIDISPEQVKENKFVREKQIKVGRKKLLNPRGNVVRDSLGHVVMVDDMRMVKAAVRETRQLKTCSVTAKVDFFDARGNALLKSFPISSTFVFENVFSTCRGDRRACDDSYLPNFDRRPLPFPSNEQMVYDTGEDLKAKLKNVIVSNRFPND
jgi:hypothetical protein